MTNRVEIGLSSNRPVFRLSLPTFDVQTTVPANMIADLTRGTAIAGTYLVGAVTPVRYSLVGGTPSNISVSFGKTFNAIPSVFFFISEGTTPNVVSNANFLVRIGTTVDGTGNVSDYFNIRDLTTSGMNIYRHSGYSGASSAFFSSTAQVIYVVCQS